MLFDYEFTSATGWIEIQNIIFKILSVKKFIIEKFEHQPQ